MRKFFLFAIAFCHLAVAAAYEIKPGEWDKKAKPVKDDPSAMSISHKVVVFSMASPYIKVDTAKKYRLSGKFRLREPLAEKPGKLKFGIQVYDEAKREILPEHSTVIEGSTAELLKPAEYGQLDVTVSNAGKWRIMQNYSYIAFNAKDDFGDLPNRSTVCIAGMKKLDGGGAEISLREPLREFYPAGTKDRLHHKLAAFLYGGALNKGITGEWREFSGIFTGEQRGMSHNIFRKGTVFVRVVVMLEGNGTLEFRDIKFEEME